MSMKVKKNNCLYLVWKNPADHSNYIVGSLYKEDKYFFEYNEEYLDKVEQGGLELLHAFPNPHKKYESAEMFLAFTSRLPDKKRRDIEKILNKYDLEEYDEFELLKRGGGRLPIDTFEFVDPIFPEDETVCRDFYIMGTKHYGKCEGVNCTEANSFNKDEELLLKAEPSNAYDKYAVQIFSGDTLLGYVPRYYSQAVNNRLKQKMSYSCKIIEVNQKCVCDECLKVRLIMPKEYNSN